MALAIVMSDNKKGLFKHINGKKRSKENIGLTFEVNGHLTRKDDEKADAFNAFFFFFPSVFNCNY